jgi:hypothetical protein
MDADSTSGERVSEQPRFLRALKATEVLLKKGDDAFWIKYFENSSKLPSYAQSFDLIAGPDHIDIQGDTTELRLSVATELRQAIDEYQGPVEIQQIYDDLYKEDIRGILGE